MTTLAAEQVETRTRAGWPAPAVAAGLLVGAVGLAEGGYFPSAWGWTTLALLWATSIGIVVASRRPTATETIAVGALAAFVAVALASAPLAEGAAREVERALVYLAALAAAFAALRRRAVLPFLAGVEVGVVVVCGYGLTTRLLSDRLGTFDAIAGSRLAEPLGYWNALGALSAIGLILGVGLAARADRLWTRAVAAAALVPLALALYFTFSRGGWIALAVGFVTAAALEPRRVRFVTALGVLAPWPAVAVLAASRQDALTTVGAPLARVAEQGAELAAIALLLAVAGAIAGTLLAIVERRLRPPAAAARAYAALLTAVLLVALAAVLVRFGAPWTIAANAWGAFSAPPPVVRDGNLNQRLFSFSGSGRVEQWRVALDAWRDAPLTGQGAGAYERYWLEHRDLPGKIRDAHSLYVEQLAELGPLGLALLVLALGVPVYAAFKVRRHPLVPAAFGAYVAYLVHAGVDWDWEMPAVTLTALFIGASIVVAARKLEDEERSMGPRLRYSLLAATLALAAVAFVGLVGNMALAQSADAARAGDWAQSESHARRAETWAPWAPEPWQRIGEAQLARGELRAAQESFRAAIERDERDWELWLDLARASTGRAQRRALAEAKRLNPLSPEIAQLRKELAELGTIEVGG